MPGRPDLLVFTSEKHEQDFDDSAIEMLDLATGRRHLLHQSGTYGRVTTDGHLLFARELTLFGAPLADDYLSLERSPAPLISGLTQSSGHGGAQYALSETGVMIYVEGPGGASALTMPTWIDLDDGTRTPLFDDPVRLFEPVISLDGTRIAFQQAFFGGNLAVYEIRRAILAPVYPSEYRQITPVWAPDGTRLAFSGQSEEQFVPSLFTMDAAGEQPPERLGTAGAAEQIPSSWSPDGKTILFDEPGDGTKPDVFAYDVASGDIEVPIASPGEDIGAVHSPDGVWVAYQSDVSGAPEVYVRRADGSGNRLQVSAGGGADPRWAADGSAIYYLAAGPSRDGLPLMSVRFTPAGTTARLTAPEPLLRIEVPAWSGYAVDPTGGRILVPLPPDSGEQLRGHMHVVVGWEEEMRRLLPGRGGE